MKRKLILIFLLISNITIAQTFKLIERIYFDSDKFEIKDGEALKLAKLWDSISNKSILEIQIIGNTDNDADSLYNLNLSKNRCLAIQDFFTTKNVSEKLIRPNYFGENRPIAPNFNEKGKQKNRRVDIRVRYQIKKIEKLEKPKAFIPPVKKDPCLRADTTIILANGTEVVFNKCEYNDIKDCIVIKTERTTDDIIENGNLLITDSNIPLISCGMFSICLSSSNNCNFKKTCFDYPLKVRFPIPDDDNRDCQSCPEGTGGVFNINPDGTWTAANEDEEKIEIVKIKGERYYEMVIKCTNCKGKKNCDCVRCGNLEGRKRRKLCPKVKLKLPARYTLLSAQIYIDCPTTILNFSSNKTKLIARKNIGKTYSKCYHGNHRIKVLATTPKGDTVRLELSPLYDINHYILFSRCKNSWRDSQKVIGLFPAKSRSIYRKYKVRKKDFDRQSNNLKPPTFELM